MERLKNVAVKKLSKTDPESRFLRDRPGYALGYMATVAVSEDHLIVAQQVNQEAAYNGLLVPMVEAVERGRGERPGQVSADRVFSPWRIWKRWSGGRSMPMCRTRIWRGR
jgi:hypothetical protein